jgi:uroporphyrinogen decarboxylase
VFLLANASIGLYSQLRSWVGTIELSYLFYDDPALVQEMVDLIVDFTLRVTRKARQEVQFDYFNFFEDFAGKGGPLISPALFRRFLLPAYKRITEEFRRDGIKHFWLDSDGDPRCLIPLMLEGGITCLWPLEVASGMDPVALRKEYGTDLALCGGIDKREIAKGREAIHRELYAKIPPLLERGGYIPFIDHAIPPDISLDDFKYYMDLKMKLIGM